MLLKDITLSNFRIYHEERHFEFSQDVTGIIGENARGKTTLLEAVYMICRGKGFREKEEYELLTFGMDSGYVVGSFFEDGNKQSRAITYKGQVSSEGEYKLLKKYFLDKAPCGQVKYARSNPPVVLFAPQHIDIIVHGPSYRREYLNGVISSGNMAYAKAIREYDAVLRRRNAVLENHTDRNELRLELTHWDEMLLENANVIQKSREDYLHFLHGNKLCADKTFKVIYHKNRIDRGRLDELFEKETVARRTLAGPQKDDIEINIMTSNDAFVNVHTYASRSQQRLAVLWLKMRELEYKARAGTRPILLLDDIYSEFDAHYRQIITSIIPNYQTVVTATEEISIPPDLARKMTTVRV